MRSSHIRSLTSLRFFAAILVVLFHFAPFLSLPMGVKQLVGMGPTGVAFFYVLSGFILTYTYYAQFRDGLSAPSLRNFWQARFARVYPMYILALLVITPLTLYTLAQTPQIYKEIPQSLLLSWVQEALLVQVYTYGSQSVWNSPGWSVACEAFFYLCFPFIAVVLARSTRRAHLLAVILGLFAVQVGLHVLAVWADLQHVFLSPDFPYSSPLMRIWEFIIGCAAGVAFLRAQEGDERYRLDARTRNLVLLVAFVLIGVGGLLKFMGNRETLELLPRVVGYTMHGYVAYTLPFVAIIYVVASGPTFLSRLLEQRWLVLLGEASYSLYIIHWIAYRGVELWGNTGHAVPRVLAGLVVIGLVALSVASLKFIEMPAREWLRPRRAVRSRAHPTPLGSKE